MIGRPPNLPRRSAAPAAINLADVQGNLVRGYTYPVAAYLFLHVLDLSLIHI